MTTRLQQEMQRIADYQTQVDIQARRIAALEAALKRLLGPCANTGGNPAGGHGCKSLGLVLCAQCKASSALFDMEAK